jgi:hypothetical protein
MFARRFSHASVTAPQPPAPNRHAPSAAARPHVEQLERRQMFTVTTGITDNELLITSGNGDTVTIDHAGTSTLVNGIAIPDSKFAFMSLNAGSFFGPGLNNVNVRATERVLFIDSPGRISSLVIGGKAGLGAQGVRGGLVVRGMDFPSKITVDDSQNASPRTWQMKSGFGDVELTGVTPQSIVIQDDGFEDFVLKGGSGGNTFNILDTPVHSGVLDIRLASVIINSGTGSDTVNVRRSSAFGIVVHGQAGHDTVNLGNNGSMAAINSFVHVDNTSSFSALNINGSSNTSPKTVSMGHFGFSGGTDPTRYVVRGLSPGEISYVTGDVDALNVKAGIGGNTITVDDTGVALGGKTSISTGTGTDRVFLRRTTTPLDVRGQNGADVIDVGNGNNAQGIKGALFVDNLISKSVLNLHNSADGNSRGVTIDADTLTARGTVTGLAPAKVTFKATDVSALGISTGAAADVFFIRGTLGANTAVHAGGGDDLFLVGSAVNKLDTIRTPLLVDGEGGVDGLRVLDQGSTTPHTYTTTATSTIRSSTFDPTVTVGFKAIEALDVFKGVVANPNPPLAKNLALSQTVYAGEFATLTGVLEDADTGDHISLTVDWGDGSGPKTRLPDRKPFSLTHKYKAAGTYTVRVIWTDSTGESNFRELTLAVKPAAKK